MNTLNAWVSRGLITGVTPGTSGKRRDFDLHTAVRIAVFAQLTSQSIEPDRASQVAFSMRDEDTQSGWLFIPSQDWRDRSGWTCIHFASLAEFAGLEDAAMPEFFVMVDVGKLAERVRAAEREWQESRGAKS